MVSKLTTFCPLTLRENNTRKKEKNKTLFFKTTSINTL